MDERSKKEQVNQTVEARLWTMYDEQRKSFRYEAYGYGVEYDPFLDQARIFRVVTNTNVVKQTETVSMEALPTNVRAILQTHLKGFRDLRYALPWLQTA